jgi:hypothetical protein
MSAHAKYAPSSAYRWVKCPGSVALAATLPAPKPTVYAMEGTIAHWCAERFLTEKKRFPKIGKKITQKDLKIDDIEEYEFEVTKDFLESVHFYCRHIQKLRQKVKIGDIFAIESKVKLNDQLYGTADCLFYQHKSKTLRVIDYKHGSGIAVEARNNMQLAIYALAAIKKLKIKPKHLKLTIVQPRAFHPDETKIRTWKVETKKVYKKWRKGFLKAIERCENETDTYISGDHCKFCDAISICPQVEKEAFELAQADFDEISAIDPEKVRRIMDSAQRIKDYLRQVEIHALNMLQIGQEVPGYKLVKRKSHRKWTDEKKVIKWLKRNGYMDDYIFKSRELLSPAQIEKLFKKTERKILKPYIEKKSAGITIAPDSDRRKAVKGDYDD